MLASQQPLLIVTNLYPVPWGLNRASFNKQQFDLLAQTQPVKIIILLAWTEWFSHRKECKASENIKYCPYFYIPKMGRRLVPFFQFLSLMFFLPWMKKQKASALLASWGFPDAIAASMLNKFLKLPFFVKVHGTDVNENCEYEPRRAMIKKWLKYATTIFCASNALGNKLIGAGIHPSKICVNYNGVNPDVFYPQTSKELIDPQNKKLIFVGSLIPTKGINELFDAFLALSKINSNVSLDILGSGPLQEQLQQKIQHHNLSHQVYLRGSIPLAEVARYIREADVLILPSYREGVPNVVLESFASGTPVIATKVGGIPEVVTSDTGLLIDAKNSQQLYNAIITAIETPWHQEKILQHAAKFDWQKNVATVIEKIGNTKEL